MESRGLCISLNNIIKGVMLKRFSPMTINNLIDASFHCLPIVCTAIHLSIFALSVLYCDQFI